MRVRRVFVVVLFLLLWGVRQSELKKCLHPNIPPVPRRKVLPSISLLTVDGSKDLAPSQVVVVGIPCYLPSEGEPTLPS